MFGEVGGTITFLIGLAQVPIANAAAILQALPLAVTMGAAMFLSEPVGWRRWLAILTGFAGVLIIIRPGLEGFSPYSLMILGTVLSRRNPRYRHPQDRHRDPLADDLNDNLRRSGAGGPCADCANGWLAAGGPADFGA
jgi:hypothetical protein